MKAYVVVRSEKSRSKHAVNGVSKFAYSRFFLDRTSAEKELRRQSKIFYDPSYDLGLEIRGVEWG